MKNQLAEKRALSRARLKGAVDFIDRALAAFEGLLIAALLGLAAVLNFSQVPARYLFGLSFSSAEEISVFLILWMVFAGMVRADRLGQNISIDILHNFLGARSGRLLWRLSDFLLAALAFAIAWNAVEAVAFSHMIGERSVSKLGAPIWVVMTIMPVAFSIVGVRALLRGVCGHDRHGASHETDLAL